MELRQVRYFLAVAEELNFSRAAARCKVSQPAISRAITMLEEEFGGLLIHRERRLTTLTELGRMVRPYLEKISHESEDAIRIAKRIAGAGKQAMRVGIMTTISPEQFTDLIVAIRAASPGIDMTFSDANAFGLKTQLLNGDLDAAIYALPGDEEEGRLHFLPLFREQMMIVVHPAHPFAKQSAIPVKDIDGESYIHRNHCEFAGYADGILREQGVTVTPVYWSDSEDWTLAMIAAGLGFGFMPAHCVRHPGVVARPVIEPEFWRVVHLATLKEAAATPALGLLVHEARRKEWFGEPSIAAATAA